MVQGTHGSQATTKDGASHQLVVRPETATSTFFHTTLRDPLRDQKKSPINRRVFSHPTFPNAPQLIRWPSDFAVSYHGTSLQLSSSWTGNLRMPPWCSCGLIAKPHHARLPLRHRITRLLPLTIAAHPPPKLLAGLIFTPYLPSPAAAAFPGHNPPQSFPCSQPAC